MKKSNQTWLAKYTFKKRWHAVNVKYRLNKRYKSAIDTYMNTQIIISAIVICIGNYILHPAHYIDPIRLTLSLLIILALSVRKVCYNENPYLFPTVKQIMQEVRNYVFAQTNYILTDSNHNQQYVWEPTKFTENFLYLNQQPQSPMILDVKDLLKEMNDNIHHINTINNADKILPLLYCITKTLSVVQFNGSICIDGIDVTDLINYIGEYNNFK